MQRIIDVSAVLLDVEGSPIPKTFKVGPDGRNVMENGEPVILVPLTLKDTLLTYCRNAHMMGIPESSLNDVWSAQVLIGLSDKEVTLTTAQYDTLKGLADNGKVKGKDNTEEQVFVLFDARMRTKELVDAAKEVVKDK